MEKKEEGEKPALLYARLAGVVEGGMCAAVIVANRNGVEGLLRGALDGDEPAEDTNSSKSATTRHKHT